MKGRDSGYHSLPFFLHLKLCPQRRTVLMCSSLNGTGSFRHSRFAVQESDIVGCAGYDKVVAFACRVGCRRVKVGRGLTLREIVAFGTGDFISVGELIARSPGLMS